MLKGHWPRPSSALSSIHLLKTFINGDRGPDRLTSRSRAAQIARTLVARGWAACWSTPGRPGLEGVNTARIVLCRQSPGATPCGFGIKHVQPLLPRIRAHAGGSLKARQSGQQAKNRRAAICPRPETGTASLHDRQVHVELRRHCRPAPRVASPGSFSPGMHAACEWASAAQLAWVSCPGSYTPGVGAIRGWHGARHAGAPGCSEHPLGLLSKRSRRRSPHRHQIAV